MSEGGAAVLGVALDFTPVVGDIKGVAEAIQDPSAINIIAAGVGIIPGVGDVVSKTLKTGANILGGAADAAKVSKRADFIVDSSGTAFPVPKGATGPVPVINPAGKETGAGYVGGTGGANGQVATMRNMNANKGNPTGYVKYENASRQPVDPISGKTVSNAQGHIAKNCPTGTRICN